MLGVKEEIIDDETLFVKNSYNSGDEKRITQLVMKLKLSIMIFFSLVDHLFLISIIYSL